MTCTPFKADYIHFPSQVDRLSSLPPELLCHIFDLAHDPLRPLTEPISRTLLPYCRQNLYRRIKLATVDSFYSLLDSIHSSPSLLGTLVNDLNISSAFTYPSSVDFYEVIGAFPRLKSLKTGYASSLRYVRADVAFPPIEQLSYECGYPATEDLETLSRLKLRTLEINFHRTINLTNYPPPYRPKLETVEEVNLWCEETEQRDRPIWTGSFAKFVTDCNPNMTSLRLCDFLYPDYRHFIGNMGSHALRITSLTLDYIGFRQHLDAFSCDHLLPLFANLSYLSLGAGTTGNSLFFNLRRLPRLASLRLSDDAHRSLDSEEFLTLVQGPNRLVSLQRLIFDCFGGLSGRRVTVEDPINSRVSISMMNDGWRRSAPGNFTVESLTELITACKDNGVAVEGDDANVLEKTADFDLEEANRSVLRCLQLNSLDDVTYSDGSSLFPDISIDNLDPEYLKLVKTEIPEKNWFRLSLE